MSDIQLFDLRNCGNLADVADGEPVSGMDSQTQLQGTSRGGTKRLDRVRPVRFASILAGVQLDRVRAKRLRGLYRLVGRIDEKAYPDPAFAQAADRRGDTIFFTDDIESPFGGDLFALLGNERDLLRMHAERDVDHLVSTRCLEVEIRSHIGCELVHVGVLHMPAIFAQMRSYSVSARVLADRCRFRRTGLDPSPGLPNGRDVIYVHIQALMSCRHWFHLSIWPQFFQEISLKKLLLALIVLAGCARASTTVDTPGRGGATGSGQLTGATTPRLAVEQFLNAVRAQDIQAMGVNFGTLRGPARDNIKSDELEKRLIILQCYFNHDKFRIASENPGEGGHRVMTVELTRGPQTRVPKFYTIRGPGARWYVDNMEIAAVNDFCRDSPRR